MKFANLAFIAILLGLLPHIALSSEDEVITESINLEGRDIIVPNDYSVTLIEDLLCFTSNVDNGKLFVIYSDLTQMNLRYEDLMEGLYGRGISLAAPKQLDKGESNSLIGEFAGDILGTASKALVISFLSSIQGSIVLISSNDAQKYSEKEKTFAYQIATQMSSINFLANRAESPQSKHNNIKPPIPNNNPEIQAKKPFKSPFDLSTIAPSQLTKTSATEDIKNQLAGVMLTLTNSHYFGSNAMNSNTGYYDTGSLTTIEKMILCPNDYYMYRNDSELNASVATENPSEQEIDNTRVSDESSDISKGIWDIGLNKNHELTLETRYPGKKPYHFTLRVDNSRVYVDGDLMGVVKKHGYCPGY